jgi:hypothetical protein
MKFLVLILGSTTLVAGGTAITSQQDVRNNMTAQRPHQEHRAASRGTDCQPVENPIFGNVAYPLIVESCTDPLYDGIDRDLDGDGKTEQCFAEYYNDCMTVYSQPGKTIRYVEGSNPPKIIAESFLNVNPDLMQYDGVTGYIHAAWLRAYVDVTNDGKPDAILLVQTSTTECSWDTENHFFYVENISEWPAACASDLNSDGTVEVNDLMQIISNWGPCE